MSHSQCSSCNSILIHQDPDLLCIKCFNKKLAEERRKRELQERQEDMERELQQHQIVKSMEDQFREFELNKRIQINQEGQRVSQELEQIYQSKRQRFNQNEGNASQEFFQPNIEEVLQYRQTLLQQMEDKRQRQVLERAQEIQQENLTIEQNKQLLENSRNWYISAVQKQKTQLKQDLEAQIKANEEQKRREFLKKQSEGYITKSTFGVYQQDRSKKEIWKCGDCNQNTEPISLSRWKS